MVGALPLRLEEAFSVRDKIVLLTGATGTIGQSIAEIFAANGAHVVITDRQQDKLDELAEKFAAHPGSVTPRAADLASVDDLKSLLAFTDQKFGRINVIIHCGAIPSSSPIEQEHDDNFDLYFHTNVRSLWILARYSLPLFQKSGGGSFITIASINGHKPYISASLYTSTKAAVMNMSRDFAHEYLRHHVRFNTVSPGATGVEMRGLTHLAENMRQPWADQARTFLEQLLTEHPEIASAHPTEIAHVLIMLASSAGQHINGEDIIVDGGFSILLDTQIAGMKKEQNQIWERMADYLRELPADAWKNGVPEWLKKKS